MPRLSAAERAVWNAPSLVDMPTAPIRRTATCLSCGRSFEPSAHQLRLHAAGKLRCAHCGGWLICEREVSETK